MADQYLSVKETSEVLDCSEQYVRKLLRYGEISGEKISGRWGVASESVQDYCIKGESSNLSVPDHGRRSFRVFRLKSYPIEIPPVGRNDITPVMLSAAKRSRNIPHSDWTIIFPDYS
jgi:excisionase family DNA binding protein